jgi:hypothetical protein
LTTSLQADKIFQKIFGQQKEIAIINVNGGVKQFSFLCRLCSCTLHNVCSTGIASVITAITKTPNAERASGAAVYIFAKIVLLIV